MTPGLAERLSKCLECGACVSSCPAGADVPAVIAAMRATMARDSGQGLSELAVRRLIGSQAPAARRLIGLGAAVYRKLPGSRFLPWYELQTRRALPTPGRGQLESLIPEISPVSGARIRVALFPGCTTSLYFQETARAAVRVLNRAGAEVVLPRRLSCCGAPYRSLGDVEKADAMRERNLRSLNLTRVDAIVTACSTCTVALKHTEVNAASTIDGASNASPETRRARTAPVMDIHELLAEIGIPATPSGSPPPVRVAWHDPCHLRRAPGATLQPREVIAGLAEVEFVESGEPSCCGGAGVFSLLHYGLSLKIGLARAEKLAATGAGIIATGCPGCRIQLDDMMARLGAPVRIVHAIDLLEGEVHASARGA